MESRYKELKNKGINIFPKKGNAPAKYEGYFFKCCRVSEAVYYSTYESILKADTIGYQLNQFEILDVDSKKLKNESKQSFNNKVLDYVDFLGLGNKVAAYYTKSLGLHIVYRYESAFTNDLKLSKEKGVDTNDYLFELLRNQATMYRTHCDFLTYSQLFDLKENLKEDEKNKILSISTTLGETPKIVHKPTGTTPSRKYESQRFKEDFDIKNVINSVFQIKKNNEVVENGKARGMYGDKRNTFYRFNDNKVLNVIDFMIEYLNAEDYKQALEIAKNEYNYTDNGF